MAKLDKWDVDNWANYFDFNSAEEFIADILNGEIAIEKMHDSVLQLAEGNLEDAQQLVQEMYREKTQPKDINNESGWDRHMRHMKPINQARTKVRG